MDADYKFFYAIQWLEGNFYPWCKQSNVPPTDAIGGAILWVIHVSVAQGRNDVSRETMRTALHKVLDDCFDTYFKINDLMKELDS